MIIYFYFIITMKTNKQVCKQCFNTIKFQALGQT